MKKVLLFSLTTIVCVFLADLIAYTYSSSPPASHAGAPSESTCTACHAGTANSGSGSITITFGDGILNTYKPDSVYTVTVQVTDITKLKFGFESTSLTSANDSAGRFIITNNTNTVLQTGSVSGKMRRYISHKNASGTSTWQFQWRAPGTNKGPITFYVAGNAANSDLNTSGDLIYTESLQITPDLTSVDTDKNQPGLKIAQYLSGLQLWYSLINPSNVEITLFDINGRILYQAAEKQASGHKEHFIANAPKHGLYFITLRSGSEVITEKIFIP